MLCKFAVLGSILLLCSVVLASGPFSRLEARLAHIRRSRQNQRISHTKASSTHSSASDVEYTSIWAGVVWEMSDGTFSNVTGTFVAPEPSGSSGDAASAWVGIDGATCGSPGLFQTGVDFAVTDSGTSYNAWCQWYPDDSLYFNDFKISAGHEIRTTIVAYTATSGMATIENLTTGQSVKQSVTSSSSLCGANAEWIVEDFQGGDGKTVSLANFGTVEFTDAHASGTGGIIYDPSGAAEDGVLSTTLQPSIIDIQQGGKVLTKVTTSQNSVTISYV